jgi:hypothetical protein
MSLSSCIPGLVEAGKIRKADAANAEAAYARHYKRLLNDMSPEAAAAAASERALKELEHAAGLRRRQTMLQVAAQRRMAEEIEAGDMFRTPLAIVERVDAQRRAVLGRLHRQMSEILFRHRRNLIGEARDKTGLNDIGREAFGERTGNANAAELVEGWRGASELARSRFNRAGGNIGKREDWGLPQHHDTLKVRARPYEEWRADIMAGIDLGRMIDDATGQPFTPDGIEAALKDAWEAIRSDGWTRQAAGAQGGAKLANRRADHRFFVFRDFESWSRYQEKYGSGTIFDAMVGHLDAMARDIALMEVMGPNPAASLKWLQDGMKKKAAEAPDPSGDGMDRARTAELRLANLYGVVSGEAMSPVSEKWARRFGGVRAYLTSAFLGSASLSAVTDLGFQAVTRAYNGLPVVGMMRGYLRLLNPASAADRKVAVRLALVAEEAAKTAASLNRYVDGVHGPEIALRLADGVMRLSGLAPWTQAGRWAFGMETLGHLADQRGKGFADLDAPLSAMLARYGIDAAMWDTIRAAEPYRHKGAEFLDVDAIEDEKAGDALLRMVLTETDYAVPTATARARAVLSFGQQPGTLGGEAVRNGLLFKSFGVGVILTHGARMIEQKGWNRAKYFAGLTITTTLLGALALQLREIAQGRDAKDMEDPAFWGKAVFQGGGYGIFGDFIKSAEQENRFGGGIAETIAGPVVGAAADVARSTGKLVGDAVNPDKDANPGREALKAARRYVPGQSLFYARLAYERLVLDQLAEEIDPDYYDAWQRMEDRAAEQGQEYYWRPGEIAPDRLPQIGEQP